MRLNAALSLAGKAGAARELDRAIPVAPDDPAAWYARALAIARPMCRDEAMQGKAPAQVQMAKK